MEDVLAKGKVKAIGVSNVSEILLEELSKTWKVVPAVNQVSLFAFTSRGRRQRLIAGRTTPILPSARAQKVLRLQEHPSPSLLPSWIYQYVQFRIAE